MRFPQDRKAVFGKKTRVEGSTAARYLLTTFHLPPSSQAFLRSTRKIGDVAHARQRDDGRCDGDSTEKQCLILSKINEDQATHGWLHDDDGKSSDARESQKLLVMCEDDFNWP